MMWQTDTHTHTDTAFYSLGLPLCLCLTFLFGLGIGLYKYGAKSRLNKKFIGPDHKASLSPKEFKEMVQNIRTFEKMLGNGIKKIEKCEKKNFFIARKSLVSKKAIKKGEKFNLENLTVKRPGNGVPASKIFQYIGKKSKFIYKEDEMINE